jgi:glucuronate isomerase
VVRPTFRPDLAINFRHPQWRAEIDRLASQTGETTTSYAGYIRALEQRRRFFIEIGATATDHAAETPFTVALPRAEAEAIFERAVAGAATAEDVRVFTGHMLMEMARMSVEDGLVMQLHPGSDRNHNAQVFERFGPDRGCDIPLATEFTRNLKPLLNRFGNDPRLTLVLFTLDETTYTRELAPLAGHYPALRLGPPWWFHDSLEGMARFRHHATETAGLYNTAGFNDDTRAFPSIPARHDVARRVDANFLAGQVSRHIIALDEAHELMRALTYELVRKTYRLE